MTRFLAKPLQFLHLTDPHFTRDFASQDSWINFIATLPRFVAPGDIHLVLVTGDISDRAQPEGYRFAKTFLSHLLATLQIPPQAIFLVPGNHDVDRARANLIIADPPQPLLASLADPRLRQFAAEPMDSFLSLVSSLKGSTTSLLETPHATPRSDVEILPLITTWLSRHSTTDYGRLSFNVASWSSTCGPRPVPEGPLTIALMHHTPEWMLLSEHIAIERFLVRHADIVLCGHLHTEQVKTIDLDGYSCVLVTGANLGSGDHPYHRALLGSVEGDGQFRLHRILRDPHRAGTADEWNLVPSQKSYSLRRVNEALMRLPEIAVANDFGARLREHYAASFRCDAIPGEPLDRPPELLLLYRRLALARMDSGVVDDQATPLWSRLSRLLERTSLSNIAERAHSLLTAITDDERSRLLIASAPPLLTGQYEKDRELLANHLVRVSLRRATTNAQPFLEDTLQDSMAIEGLVTVADSPDFAKVMDDLKDVVRSDEGGLGDAHVWAVILLHGAPPSDSRSSQHLASLRSRLQAQLASVSVPLVEWRKAAITLLSEVLDTVDLPTLLGSSNATVPESGEPTPASAVGSRADLWRSLAMSDEFVEVWRSIAGILHSSDIAALAYRPILNRGQLGLRAVASAAMRIVFLHPGCVHSFPTPLQGLELVLERLCWQFLSSYHRLGDPCEAVHFLRKAPTSLLDLARTGMTRSLVQLPAQATLQGLVGVKEEVKLIVESTFRTTLLMTMETPTLGLDELLVSSRMLAVLGGPGSGKTTLLRHLALTCGGEFLPIFVPLSRWNAHTALRPCIDEALGAAGCTLHQVLVASDRRLLLLLDGLDEVRDLDGSSASSELRQMVSQFQTSQVVITSRFGAAHFLPDSAACPRYYLHKLTEDDVVEYVRAWFGPDSAKGRAARSRVLSDPLLLESLRTPFILRMFCGLLAVGVAPNEAWASRSEMYRAICEHLLHTRDEQKGLELRFPLADKWSALAAIGSMAMEKGLSPIPVESLQASLADSSDGDARARASSLLQEIYQRSQLLVKVGDTSFDFVHYSIREFFAVQGWARNQSWRSWDDSSDRMFLTESTPRFIVHADPGIRDSLAVRLSALYKSTPMQPLAVAAMRTEVLSSCPADEQRAHVRELVEAVGRDTLVHIEEASSVFTQMCLLASQPSEIAKDLISILQNLAETDNTATGAARLLRLCSHLQEPAVVDYLALLLEHCRPSLREAVNSSLASVGARVAADRVRRALVERGDLALARTCMLVGSTWSEALAPHLDAMLRSHIASLAIGNAPMIDVVGLLGPADGVAIASDVFREVLRALFAPSRDGRVMRVLNGLSLERRAWLSEQLMDRGRPQAPTMPPLRLKDYPDVVTLIAQHYALDVRVAIPPSRDTGNPPIHRTDFEDTVVSLCRDVADQDCISLLFSWADAGPMRVTHKCREALVLMKKRYVDYLPNDLGSLCAQTVEDLWLVLRGESTSAPCLGRARAERSARVRYLSCLGQTEWRGIEDAVGRLPRRPEPADWPTIQFRFGTLMKALHLRRASLPLHSGGFNVVKDEGWERIDSYLQRSHDVGGGVVR